jgi:methylglutaconyl-CoA hydratase
MSAAASEKPVLWSVDARGVATVTLNRPHVNNAYDGAISGGLHDAMDALEKIAALRVVVLRGNGKHFQAGADLAWIRDVAAESEEANVRVSRATAEAIRRLDGVSVPTIALVQGGCFGGGTGIVAACDIAVAADDAVFALSEVRLGILPAVISPYVIRRLGDRAARELMLTGERFDGGAALRAGLVHHVVPAAGLDEKVDERIAALLAGAPHAQARIKTLLELYADSIWDEYRAAVPRVLAEVRGGQEAKDGLSAFFEKRKPAWAGK